MKIVRPLPDFSEVNEFFSYDSDAGIIYWRKNRPGKAAGKSGDPVKTFTSSVGYSVINFKHCTILVHRIVWLLIHGEWPVGIIDHINGNKTDNRICNLRLATHSQNMANSKIHSNNKSGFKGVSWIAAKNKWRAEISFNNKRQSLGYFESAKEASDAYSKKASEVHMDFVRKIDG